MLYNLSFFYVHCFYVNQLHAEITETTDFKSKIKSVLKF